MGEALYPKGVIQVLCTDMKLSTSTMMLNTQMAYAMIFAKILIKSDQILIIYRKKHIILSKSKNPTSKTYQDLGIGVLGYWGGVNGVYLFWAYWGELIN